MAHKLTKTARIILRSRVRRHPNSASILAGRSVASISNADLVQAALLLALDIPTPEQCKKYDDAKARGEADPVAHADNLAKLTGIGGQGMAHISLIASVTDPDDEKPSVNPDDDDDEDDGDADATPAAQTRTTDTVEDIKAKAKAKAAEIREKLGRGDFEGFVKELESLAETALTPPPAPIIKTVAAIDPAKIKGRVPQVTGQKTMKQAGIVAAWPVIDARTAMPTYDADDAPNVDPDYIWPDQTGPALAAMARGGNVMLWGPAGTGKTSFPQQVAARWGRPFVRISCTEDTEASTLVGMTVPDTASGGVKWQDGQLVAAIRKPGTIVLIDEPSIARPGALFVLQALLDHDRAVHIAETGEVVRAAPDVIVLLADNTNGTGDTNGNYEGTRRLNRAFLDRCALTVHLDYLPADREAVALVARTGVNKRAAAALCKFAALTRAKAGDGAISHGIGFRRLQALASCLVDGADPAHAFQLTVIETSPHDDREALRQMWTSDVNPSALK